MTWWSGTRLNGGCVHSYTGAGAEVALLDRAPVLLAVPARVRRAGDLPAAEPVGVGRAAPVVRTSVSDSTWKIGSAPTRVGRGADDERVPVEHRLTCGSTRS